MRKLFQGRWSIVIGFLAALLGLTGLNVLMFQTELDISPLATTVPAAPHLASSAEASLHYSTAELDLPQTLTRPIFSPTRRDFITPPTEPEPIAETIEEVEEKPQVARRSPPAIKLRGTRIVDGKLSALIAVNDRNADWFGQGDNVQGWTVTSISPERMSLASGSQSVVFSLYETAKVGVVDAAE